MITSCKRALIRWWYCLLTYRDYVHELNRRVAVEQKLLDMFHGKRPTPDHETCRQLARDLAGTNNQDDLWPRA